MPSEPPGLEADANGLWGHSKEVPVGLSMEVMTGDGRCRESVI